MTGRERTYKPGTETELKNTMINSGNQQKTSRHNLGALVFLAVIFFFNFIARVILAPLLPAIEKDLHLSHSASGSLFLLLSAGYFVSLAGSGFVSSRLTHRKTIILSSVTVGLALIGICFSRNRDYFDQGRSGIGEGNDKTRSAIFIGEFMGTPPLPVDKG